MTLNEMWHKWLLTISIEVLFRNPTSTKHMYYTVSHLPTVKNPETAVISTRHLMTLCVIRSKTDGKAAKVKQQTE